MNVEGKSIYVFIWNESPGDVDSDFVYIIYQRT